MLDGALSTEDFKASLRKSFVDAGLLEDDSECFKQFRLQEEGLSHEEHPAGA